MPLDLISPNFVASWIYFPSTQYMASLLRAFLGAVPKARLDWGMEQEPALDQIRDHK
jgi:hypothetical protein